MACGGYTEYLRGCSVHLWETKVHCLEQRHWKTVFLHNMDRLCNFSRMDSVESDTVHVDFTVN